MLLLYAGFLGLSYFNSILNLPVLLIIGLLIAPLVFPKRFASHLPSVSRTVQFSIDEKTDTIVFDGRAYPLAQLQWYRLDFSGKLAHQLVLKFQHQPRLQIATWADDSRSNKNLWHCRDYIRSAAAAGRIDADDDYARSGWLAVAWVLLLSLPIVWLLPLVMIRVDGTLLSAVSMWTGMVLSFAAVVMLAQRS